MPLYDFRCSSGHLFERFVALTDFNQQQFCSCGSEAARLISAPMFSVDQTEYSCPITGERISSKHQHEENLKRHDCRVLEPGEKESNLRKRQDAEAQFDKSLENSIEKELSNWGSDKMEKLANELVNGKVDLQYERSTVS